jgi:c(7)-type cytochrome triheme protein
MPPLPLDVLIIAKSDFVDDVIYPHEIHTWWLKCEVCHPKIFVPAKGQNKMTMSGIAEGKWCGRCHGKVAFPLTDCTRCHVSPK